MGTLVGPLTDGTMADKSLGEKLEALLVPVLSSAVVMLLTKAFGVEAERAAQVVAAATGVLRPLARHFAAMLDDDHGRDGKAIDRETGVGVLQSVLLQLVSRVCATLLSKSGEDEGILHIVVRHVLEALSQLASALATTKGSGVLPTKGKLVTVLMPVLKSLVLMLLTKAFGVEAWRAQQFMTVAGDA